MDDKRIIELFLARDEEAIKKTQEKYGAICRTIAANILSQREDVEECVNDVMLALWNAIPPEVPKDLKAYLTRAVRNRARDISRETNAWKRGGRVQIVGDEFLSLLDDGTDLASDFEAKRAGEIISRVLESIPEADKKIFVLRYWLGMSIEQIMHQMNFGESRVKVSLHRTRKKIADDSFIHQIFNSHFTVHYSFPLS